MMLLRRACTLQRCLSSTRTLLSEKTQRTSAVPKAHTLINHQEYRRLFSISILSYDKPLNDIPEVVTTISKDNVSSVDTPKDRSVTGTRAVDVYSLVDNEYCSTLEVDDRVIGVNPRVDILHRNVVWYRACMRAGTANSQRRGEVRGKAKKPWRQKGTGRARHGSRSSPLWKGGGSAKGPKPKDYSYNLPIPIRRLGLQVALTCRYFQNDLSVVESFGELPESLDAFASLLEERGWRNALFVDTEENEQLHMLTKELTSAHTNPLGCAQFKVSSSHVKVLHVYGILLQKKLVFSAQALRDLERRLLTNEALPDEYQPKDSMDMKISYERRKFLEKRGVWPRKKSEPDYSRRMKLAPELEYYTDGKLPSTSLRQHQGSDGGGNSHGELMRWVYSQPGPTLPTR